MVHGLWLIMLYLVFHLWLNFMGELQMFGDGLFYEGGLRVFLGGSGYKSGLAIADFNQQCRKFLHCAGGHGSYNVPSWVAVDKHGDLTMVVYLHLCFFVFASHGRWLMSWIMCVQLMRCCRVLLHFPALLCLPAVSACRSGGMQLPWVTTGGCGTFLCTRWVGKVLSSELLLVVLEWLQLCCAASCWDPLLATVTFVEKDVPAVH
jgi:hypothetical protein